MVTSTSLLSDVFFAHTAHPTLADLSSWREIHPLDATPTISTKVGVFGDDLTGFYADCAVAGIDVCIPTDYHKYTGWAMGVQWTWETIPANNALTGVCFSADSTCVKIKTVSGSTNVI